LILAFTNNARSDLRQIVTAISSDNPNRAISFVDELEQRCKALMKAPLAYAILPRYFDNGIRRIVHGNYLIFYRVGDEEITILRVLHSAMDIDVQMFGG
jgi:toxin ParE1/3/4